MKNRVRVIVISYIVVFSTITAYCQTEIKYCGTSFYPSPDGKKVIMVDRELGEIGCWGYSSRLYNLPINCNEFVTLNIFDDILWDVSSSKIITTKVSEDGFYDSQTYVNTSIVILDTLSNIVDEIKYASSPIIFGNTIYFLREYDIIKNSYVPMIYQYNLVTKKEKIVYVFDDKYTFWSEQVDIIVYPKIKLRVGYHPTGITGILISKDNINELFTFVISEYFLDGKLSFWKKGDYSDDRNLPIDGIIK